MIHTSVITLRIHIGRDRKSDSIIKMHLSIKSFEEGS